MLLKYVEVQNTPQKRQKKIEWFHVFCYHVSPKTCWLKLDTFCR